MQIEPRISFRNVAHNERVEAQVREKIAELEQFHPRIVNCQVVIDAPHRQHQTGTLYDIRIDVSVPGRDIVVTREAGRDHAHEDIHVAVRDAFDAVRRRLEDRVRLMSPQRRKRHPETLHGRIDRLFAGEGYGFIESEFGEEVYFQEDSLTRAVWDQLAVDGRVRFKQLDGEKGPYAIHVTPQGAED